MKEKKKIRTWKKVLIILGGVVVLVVGTLAGILVDGYLYGKNYDPKIAPKVELNYNDSIKTMKAVGRGIYDEEGNRFDIKGVNFGNWLFQEGWMTVNSIGPIVDKNGHYTKVNEDGIVEEYEEMFQEEVDEHLRNNPNLTEEQIDELYEVYYSTYCTEVDFKNIKSIGFNTIRLPMYYRNFMEGPDDKLVMKENAFEKIDWFLEMAKKYDLRVILDMHGVVGGQSGFEHSGTRRIDFWDNEVYQEEMCILWSEIAKHYVTPIEEGGRVDLASTILSFDLINEPVNRNTPSTGKKQWDVMDKIYDAIREVNKEHIVCIEGVWFFTSAPDPKLYGWENIMYEYHLYNWSENIVSNEVVYDFLWATLSVSDYEVPKFIGEFTFFNKEDNWIKWLNKYDEMGFGWTFWSYKTISLGWWDSSWGLAVQKLHLYNKDGVKYDETDTLKLDLRTATYDEIYEKWSKEYTDDLSTEENEGVYRFDGVTYKVMERYFAQDKFKA